MTLTLQLSDEQANVLQAKAAAEGLSLEVWIGKLAEPTAEARPPRRNIADFIVDSMRDVPPELMATMPEDGASQHDHYIYGWPKREI